MFTVIDLETTGLNPLDCQVIQVGAIKLDSRFNEIDSYRTYVKLNEGMVLSDFIKEYTGITETNLENGIPDKEAFTVLKHFIGNDIIVAQFASFDLGFLPFGDDFDFLCTKSIFHLLHPDMKNGLDNIIDYYAINMDGHRHDAVYDCRLTAKALKHISLEDNDVYKYMNNMTTPVNRPLRFVPKRALVHQ